MTEIWKRHIVEDDGSGLAPDTIMTGRGQMLANAKRLTEIAAELEEMADGYREKADELLREAARNRIAAACIAEAARAIA